MLAANAASAPPNRIASARCSGQPAPPLATTGTETASRNGSRDLQVVAVLRAVGIHRGQHDLAGPQAFDLAGPGDGFQAGADAARR